MICDHIEARLEGGDKENWLYSGGSSMLIQTLGAEQVGVGSRTMVQVSESSLSQGVGLRGWEQTAAEGHKD